MISNMGFSDFNQGMVWNGKFRYGIYDAKMEWNGRFQEWNERQSSILPYQFHTRFVHCTVFTEKCVPMSGSDK